MTHSNSCFRLDEFLAGDLVGAPRGEFERHLEECPSCREEAESYSRIAELLKAAEREPGGCPPLLSARVHEAVSRRRSRRRIAASAAAAAIVLAAIGGFAWMGGGRLDPAAPPEEPESIAAAREHEATPAIAPESPEIVPVVEAPGPVPPEPSGPEAVTVEFSDDAIGVPIETDDPSVTIVWVYPTLTQVAISD